MVFVHDVVVFASIFYNVPCNRLRSAIRILIISHMRGWLVLCFGFVVIGTLLSAAGCSEDSGWNAGMNGVPVNQGGDQAPTGSQEPPQSPPGSGAVEYVPTGRY
jgi:hypothetical protein